MAARSRPRQATKDDTGDAHEERNMWLSMVAEIKKLHGLNLRANEVMAEINRDEEMFMEECGGLCILLVCSANPCRREPNC
jgi:hypothetical protein